MSHCVPDFFLISFDEAESVKLHLLIPTATPCEFDEQVGSLVFISSIDKELRSIFV